MSEEQLQAKCYEWFHNEYPEHRQMLFHVPNGELRDKITANKLKAMGVQKGVADFGLVTSYMGTIWIEMKIPGGTQSKEQESFQAKVEARKQIYLICYSFEEFQNIIKAFII